MRTFQRHPFTGRRLAIVALVVGILLTLVSCTTRSADQGQGENPTVISYAAAASRLSGLDPFETEEQLRDWARIGLASHLELDTARFRDAAYDTLPVREAAFSDLSKQPTGPGRALFDGRGVLHVLVPRGDPHESRTIGLAIDQYRTDAGADPQQVQIDHYQVNPRAQTIELFPDKPAPVAEVRSAHGFVTMRVDEMKGLTDFLARTRHLSWLEVRGSEVWAGGWNWPEVPAAALDAEDVSVIQRGYLQPASEPRPVFSLDAGPTETRDDILAVVPDLRPELADRMISMNWTDSVFRSADELATLVDSAIFHDGPLPAELSALGVPMDRTQLWALKLMLAGQSGYGQARYDGRLEGTKVGMTLFYTDYVAKDWVAGIGTGVPTNAVGGFIADSDAVTPWSHCAEAEFSNVEFGRLWFGQDDSGFTFDGDRVSIGAQASRLFSRTEEDGGTEVEPSFSFGRGLRWWDRHYQAVADYEPQYQRLEQIMRWSGALEWLATNTQARLPQLDDAAIRSDLRFEDWYTQHNELRERSPIEFVTPPSATQEAVLTKTSKLYQDCGLLGIFGGVSLGDLIQRKGGRSFEADLPVPVQRGGLFDETSRFDPATGTGQIKQVSIDSQGRVVDSVQRTLSTAADGRAVVDVAADGRRVISLQSMKAWLADTAPRKLKVEIAADRGSISERVEFQGEELGQLAVRKYAGPDLDTVTVQWKRGPLDRTLRILGSIQERLTAQPAAGLPSAKDGGLYSYQDGSGLTRSKIGGPDEPWLSITNELTPPGEQLAFRLGAPDPQTGTAQFFLAKSAPRPELPPGGGGLPPWMEVTPASGDRPAQARVVGPPGPDARRVQVTTPEGRDATTLYQIGDHALARPDDPILGLNGTVEGAALLRDYPKVAQAMRDAAQADDGLLRGVPLDGDGVALARADGVTVAAADHAWAGRVLEAIAFDPSRQVPLFRNDSGRLLHLDPSPLTVAPGSARRTTLGEARDTAGGEPYLHRSMLVVEKGVPIADALPRDTNVTVRAAVVAERPSAERTATQPDIRTYGGGEWWRLPPTSAGSGGGPTPSTTPNPPVPGGAAAGPGGQILLVCPDPDDKSPGDPKPPGCEE